MLKRISATLVCSVLFIVACTPAAETTKTEKDKTDPRSSSSDVTSDDDNEDDDDCDEDDSAGGGGGGGGLTAADPATLEKCECKTGGAARCVPSSAIPASFAKQLGACDDGVCVPDKLVKSGGAAPKQCKSIVGDGRCMSLCVPAVAEKKGVLDRGEGDACDADELCVPCLNPLEGNEPTGVCEIGKSSGSSGKKCGKKKKTSTPSEPAEPSNDGDAAQCPYKGAPIDTSKFPACGAGGRCVPATAVSEGQRARLDACGGGLCAPEKQVANAGQYLPPTCVSVAGAEGRCLSTVIKDVAAKKGFLPQSTCDAGELCAPCFNPADGSDTGACRSVSCDAPKEPAKQFPQCCKGKGRCVPEAAISNPKQKERLGSDGCEEGAELCAPEEDINRTTKRPSCNGKLKVLGTTYVGACVSRCTDLGIKGVFLDQSTCDGDHVCAPCIDPTSKESTGACD
ncbi:MAG: hypothetical protein KIT84_13545 [Labilithrix sp.]|nr:hypothetical protein [Labilithrix sp.]MCW5812042.1 hypothetical protein [Labilithrix sp.]